MHSPEQVELHLPVTGPTTRMLAYVIDLAVIYALEFVLFVGVMAASPAGEWLVGRMRGVAVPKPGEAPSEKDLGVVLLFFAFFLLGQLVVEWTYFIAVEVMTNGRSFGKRVMRLRVVRDGGSPITLRDSIVRNLLRMVDMLPMNYLIGLVAMLVSREGKRLGDLAAGTVVVRLDRPPAVAPIADVGDDDDAAFRFERAQIEALGPRERELLRAALRRASRARSIEERPSSGRRYVPRPRPADPDRLRGSDELRPEEAAAALELAVEALRERIGYRPIAPDERLAFVRALFRASRKR